MTRVLDRFESVPPKILHDDIVPIQSDLIADDIRAYVHTRVREDNGFKRWRSLPEVQDEIESLG